MGVQEAVKVLQNNLKKLKVLRSVGKTDSEIAHAMGMDTKTFLDAVESEIYIKELYEKSGDALLQDIESKFLENVLEDLEKGKNEDAKWVLERRTDKYVKKEKTELSGGLTIDEIIRNN